MSAQGTSSPSTQTFASASSRRRRTRPDKKSRPASSRSRDMTEDWLSALCPANTASERTSRRWSLRCAMSSALLDASTATRWSWDMRCNWVVRAMASSVGDTPWESRPSSHSSRASSLSRSAFGVWPETTTRFCRSRPRSASTPSGASSSRTCAFVPLSPKELTVARRGPCSGDLQTCSSEGK